MPLLYIAVSFVFLIFIMIKLRVNAFIALLLSAFLVGSLNKMPLPSILGSVTQGIGGTIGDLVLILAFGAMLGKIMEVTGGAYTITNKIVQTLGKSRITYAILIAGFIIGMPMMYNASFLVLIPIIYSFSYVSKIPLMQLGIPLSASLSIAHGYLPPHPAPVVVSQMYNADINTVFLYGLTFSIPAIFLAGILLPKFFRHLEVTPPPSLFSPQEFNDNNTPAFALSLLCATFPFLLMASAAVLKDLKIELIDFIGNPNIALFLAVLLSLYLLGIRKGKTMDFMMKKLGIAIASIAMIILIIAAGGAFKQVLTDSGSADYIRDITRGLTFNPIVLAWLMAAVIRLVIGSATVATITAAGIMSPIVQSADVSKEIMVLATGSGSLMFSHFNDIGFWMFKEYYNVSIKQTFMIWTVMECLIGIVGLIGCLILNNVL
jgi:Gnt-I system high-affinity gluconate transporter